jgi:hypothetical protein
MSASKKPCLDITPRQPAPYIPLDLWFELIFKRLPLDDWVRLRRVCHAVYACAKLQAAIKMGKMCMFGTSDQCYWNCASGCLESSSVLLLSTVSFGFKRYNFGRLFMMGVYSSNERLMRQFASDHASIGKEATYWKRLGACSFKIGTDDWRVSTYYRGIPSDFVAYIKAHPIFGLYEWGTRGII